MFQLPQYELMRVPQLQERIRKWLDFTLGTKDTSWYFPHSLVSHFHQAWAEGEEQPLQMKLDSALKSSISQRWWKRDQSNPKETILRLIAADPELAAIAFKDLANEQATLEGRLSRFEFYLDELLQIHRKKFPRDIESHHQQDAAMISLYLAGFYPDKYCLYPGLKNFQEFGAYVGSREPIMIDDLARYQKVAGSVFKFLLQDTEYPRLLELRTAAKHPVVFMPLQSVYEIISFKE